MIETPTPTEARPDAYPVVGALLGRAFVNDPIAAVISGRSEADRAHFLARGYTDLIKVSHGLGHIFEVRLDDAPAGAVLYYGPGAYPLTAWRKVRLAARALRYGAGAIRRTLTYSRALDRHHPTRPHVYLAALGVDPALHGRGVGSALIRHVLSEADSHAVGTYLETTNPRNLPLYERLGFKIAATFTVLKVDNWCFWRPPQAAGTNGPQVADTGL